MFIFVRGWGWSKLKKAEKSRTRTYGPPFVFQLTKEGEIQEPFKKMEAKGKSKRVLKTTVTKLSNKFRPVHNTLKLAITILLYFWRKKSI